MSRDPSSARGPASGRGTPYRGGAPTGAKHAPEESGLVGELIRQFADPFAFYRELVQNSIDAGATQIHAQLVWEPGPDGEPGIVRVTVRDDGTGMSREVLEQQLTVLFRSSKEAREDAIGKFGIGFVSVLAVSPEVVIVDTSLGDGVRWSLHLHLDQTFDLYRADAARERGTSVTLHVPVPAAEQGAFFERSEAAIRRWCRHARIPIRFVAFEPGKSDPVRDLRVDEPLSIEAVVSVQARSRDGLTAVVCGLARTGERYGAFFNQGLLLHETRDHELGEVVWKAMDSRLEHTLSRDDVRRDESYARVIELVGRTIRGPLMDALAAELRTASEAYARGSEGAGARLLELMSVQSRSAFRLHPSVLTLPIVPLPVGRHVARLDEVERLVSLGGRTPLSSALARAGRVVLDLGYAKTDDDRTLVMRWLSEMSDATFEADVDRESLLEPVGPTAHDEVLLAQLADRLEVLRRPSAIVLAQVHGSARSALAFAGGTRGDPWLVSNAERGADPFRFLLRPPLVLRVDHPIVDAARRRAEDAPVLASALLARAILVERGALTPARDATLTERALRDALARGDA